ncbi:MAG: hypothetical protein ACLTPN_04900 [Clostridia bacterium]
MLNRLKQFTRTKEFHLSMIILIIAIIIFTVGIIVLRYNVEGETNMPFELSKIAIISSQEGVDKETQDSKWAFDIYQANDIYLYISKNDKYSKQEMIKEITIDNFKIEKQNNENIENIKIYKPDAQNENTILKNKEENIVESIQYTGAVESNIKNMQISNQGGIIVFRCSNNNIAEYKSNEEEINHNQLLKKAGITQEKLKIKLTFDLTITMEEGKKYKTTIDLEMPQGNIIEDGITSTEITDLSNVIFKREKN